MSKKIHTQEITIDGNDGTGKSTIIAKLRELGYIVKDRGVPTKLTDDPNFPVPPNGIYVILDTSVETSRERLEAAGRDLTEKFHTVADLTFYRQRFQEIAKTLPGATLINADQPIDGVVRDCVLFFQTQGIARHI